AAASAFEGKCGMTWADFYLICFLVGFALSLISVLSGAFHVHLPGLHHIHGAHGSGSWSSSMFNLATITAFLAWFGGVGFLLSKFSGLWFWFAFSIAVGGGLTGSAIVFGFLFKVLLANEQPLNTMDYEMIGVLGRVSSSIRESGTGEI